MQRNRFEVAGYLATKPAVRRLPSGTPVANVRLGETYRYQDADGKSQQQTNWHSLSFYGDLSRVAMTSRKATISSSRAPSSSANSRRKAMEHSGPSMKSSFGTAT